MKKLIVLALAGLAALTLAACGGGERSGAPPELTGEWRQVSDGEWYHIATITGDTIEIYRYLPAYNEKELYWWGTFEPPTTAQEPYAWRSVNDLEKAGTSVRASREETKTFTYKNTRIRYIVTAGHLQMTYELEKEESPAS